jgi:DNA modification methylase
MTPYYSHAGIVIYHGDCRDILPHVTADVVVTDPPYGISYESGHDGVLARSILGDLDTSLRDWVLNIWPGPALVFGTWRVDRPIRARMLLVWDAGGALGMGDLSLPWKPSHQEIYVVGSGFVGERTSDTLAFPPVQSSAWRGRTHPHEKPVPLLKELLSKCPFGTILDPFMGSGTTLVAAKQLGRKAIGIEIEERYCEIAVKRLQQEVLPLERREPEPTQAGLLEALV